MGIVLDINPTIVFTNPFNISNKDKIENIPDKDDSIYESETQLINQTDGQTKINKFGVKLFFI